MINPDRAELGPQSTLEPENPKKNGHLPRWLRVPAFTTRTCLALLATTPGIIIAIDATNHREDRFIIDTTVSINNESLQQQPYNFYLDSRLEPPGLNTGIDIVAGQQINIKASGKAQYGYQGTECIGYPETDPDGKRYLPNSICSPKIDSNAILSSAAIGQLIARVGSDTWFLVGSYYTEKAKSSGRLFFLYNESYWSDNTKGYNINVDVITPPTPTPKLIRTPTPTPYVVETYPQKESNGDVLMVSKYSDGRFTFSTQAYIYF